MNHKKYYSTVLAIFLILSFACSAKENLRPQLEERPTLNAAPKLAVVNIAHAQAWALPMDKSKVKFSVSGGDILQIVSRHTEMENYLDEDGYWYEIKKDEQNAWLFSTLLILCDDESQAKLVSDRVNASLFFR